MPTTGRLTGSIPACAGEPVTGRRCRIAEGVYPRVCGGTASGKVVCSSQKGLSPRVRGNRAPDSATAQSIRSIPACAGEPGVYR